MPGRGMPLPWASSPRIVGTLFSARCCSRTSLPQNAGLSQPTAQPAPAITGLISADSSWPCSG